MHILSKIVFLVFILSSCTYGLAAQDADCSFEKVVSYYQKSLAYSSTERDSYKFYLNKVITTKEEGCKNAYVLQLLDSYKLKSIIALAEIELEKENYTQSIAYLDKIHDTSIFVNELPVQDKIISKLYAQNYYKLEKKEEAVRQLLPYTMSISRRGTDTELVDLCTEMLLNLYSKDYLIKEYHKSIEAYNRVPSEHNLNNYWITFLGVNIRLGIFRPIGTVLRYEKRAIEHYLKNQLLYKTLVDYKVE